MNWRSINPKGIEALRDGGVCIHDSCRLLRAGARRALGAGWGGGADGRGGGGGRRWDGVNVKR